MTENLPKKKIMVRRVTSPVRPRAVEETALQVSSWEDSPLDLPEPKQAISLRVDRDVLEFFKSGGKGYQTRMNAVLRAYMKSQKR
ncbi:MAG: BrnA antitoxin family protein [Marivivens sp.]|uniref:BrnA antitoxin family protein n=1 Tax=Marivivens sp. TaxID=1978374 RepID=UPI0017A9012B|nr:BrnA antitoxin family protein [Marivivens sp.]NVJ94328.1 BrnA antitoxin family protein [Marivivens sp.]